MQIGMCRCWASAEEALVPLERTTSWQSNARVYLAIAYVRGKRVDDAKQIIARALKADNLREFTLRRWLRNIPRYSSPENVARLQLMARCAPGTDNPRRAPHCLQQCPPENAIRPIVGIQQTRHASLSSWKDSSTLDARAVRSARPSLFII